MPELLLLSLKASDRIAIGSAIFAAGSLVVAVLALRNARAATKLAAESMRRQFDVSHSFSGERIRRLEKYIEIHTRLNNDSQFAVRIVEVKLEDESSSPLVAKGDESAPTADQPVVLKEHVPKKIDPRQGRVFTVRWDPDKVTLHQRARATFRTDTDMIEPAQWHEIPTAMGS
jgi:hypothetical protein